MLEDIKFSLLEWRTERYSDTVNNSLSYFENCVGFVEGTEFSVASLTENDSKKAGGSRGK